MINFLSLPVMNKHRHPSFLHCLRRSRWILWVQFMTFLGWTVSAPRLNAVYEPVADFSWAEPWSWNPQWQTNDPANDPEPPDGADWSDVDSDGIPAWLEEWYGILHACPINMAGNPDCDGDGATDSEELLVMGTDPLDAFSCGASWLDGTPLNDLDWWLEVSTDTDADGLNNFDEITVWQTDPSNPDSDSDGWDDLAESAHGTGLSPDPSSPTNADSDGDGMTDLIDDLLTNHAAGDWDGDGLTNAAEYSTHGTSMLQSDTDWDGLADGYELRTLSASGEVKAASNPTSEDTDGDSIMDGEDEDCWFPIEWAMRGWTEELTITGPAALLPAGQAGELFTSPEFTTSGNFGDCVWQLIPGSGAEEGMAFSGAYLTGTLSAGVYSFTAVATDQAGRSAQASFQLVIEAGMDPVSFATGSHLGSFEVNSTWQVQLEASGGSGSGYLFSDPAYGLPGGVALSSEGLLTGSIAVEGNYQFAVQVTDSVGNQAQQDFMLEISPPGVPPLVITPQVLPPAHAGESYSATLQASGGSGALSWSYSAQQLPSGLELTSSGSTLTISGSLPGDAILGDYPVEVTAWTEGGQSATASLILRAKLPPPPQIVFNPPAQADVSIWTPLPAMFSASGGLGEYSWQISSRGSLPAGIGLDPITGQWTGEFEEPGNHSVGISVTDGVSTVSAVILLRALDRDADGDSVLASLEHAAGAALGIAMNDSSTESNGRGTTDWLVYHQALLHADDSALDEDGDGLGPQLEAFLGTDPLLRDSDGDQRPDWWVWYQAHLQFMETEDMDVDGLGALLEGFLRTQDSLQDSDGDGLSDASEWAYFDYSDPAASDTDEDGLDDGSEAAQLTQARFRDTDGDSLTDGEEVNGAFGGIILDPLLQDTDGDGIPDYAEVDLTDTDEGGIPDRLEEHWGLDPSIPHDELDDADGDGATNLAAYLSGIDIRASFGPQFDPDGDRITTVFEMDAGLDPADRNDGADDPDGDFLTNTEEFKSHLLTGAASTNPFQALTDNLPLRQILDRDDLTGALARDASGQPVMRPAASDYEWQLRQELFMHPVCRDGVQRDLTRDNGPLDPSRQYDDDWDLDGASNLNELFPPGGGRPSDPRVWNAPPVLAESLPDAEVEESYWHRLTVSGGQGPFTFEITQGGPAPGLALAPSGILAGMPEDFGSYPFTIQVTDALGRTASQEVTLTVSTRFRFTTPESLGVHRTGGFSTQLDVTDVPSGSIVAFSSSDLPPQATLSEEGLLTVDGSQPGGHSFTVTATDATSPLLETTSRQFGISFVPPVTLSYPQPAVREMYLENAVSILPEAATGMWPLAFTATGLPPGLQIHPTTGAITGTPTTPGSYAVGVTLTDGLESAPQAAYATLTLRVFESPVIISTAGIPAGTKGQAYAGQVTASGGTGALHYSASGLPAGLLLDGSTGAITGTPTGFGPHAVTLTVTDSHPDFPTTATAAVSLEVSSTTDLLLRTNLDAPGRTGQFYAGGVSGAYGLPPYTYALIEGTLPSGLAFNTATGIVSGTPTSATSRALRFRVTDSNDPPLTAEAAATIYTYDFFPLALATTQEQLQGVPNVPYSVTLTGTGGNPLDPSGYFIAVTGLDENPAGLVFDPANHSLNASDPPPSTEPIQISITVTRGQESITEPRTITFAPPVGLPPQTLPSGRVGDAYTTQLTAQGGFGLYTFTLPLGASLPQGLTLLPTGRITGTPTEGSLEPFPLDVTVKDAHGRQASGSLPLIIDPPPPPPLTVVIEGSGFTAVAGKEITLPATATGGVAPLTWSNRQFTFNTPGTHTATVTVTDANGDSDSDSVTVEVSALEITVSGHKTIVAQNSFAQVVFTANDGESHTEVVDTSTPGNKQIPWTHSSGVTANASVYVKPDYSHLPTLNLGGSGGGGGAGGAIPNPPDIPVTSGPAAPGAFWEHRSISESSGDISGNWNEVFMAWNETGGSAELAIVQYDGGSILLSGRKWQTSDSSVRQTSETQALPQFEDLAWSEGFGGASQSVPLNGSLHKLIYMPPDTQRSPPPNVPYDTSTLEASGTLKDVKKETKSQVRLKRDPASGSTEAITVPYLMLITTESQGANGSTTTTTKVEAASATLGEGQNESSPILITAQPGETKTLLPFEVKVVDRDDPKRTWTDAQTLSGGTVYAGKESGDMISWKLSGLDSGTFTWKATGPTGEVINGPTGSGKNEWKIADGDTDTANDWLKWKPGKYKIKCTVQPSSGASFDIDLDQEIGWRTESWMVIGQIVQTHTHDGDAPAVIEYNGGLDLSSPVVSFRRAVVHDIVGWFPIGPAADPMREAVAVTPLPITGKLTEAWFGYWAMVMPHALTPKGPFAGSSPLGIGNVTEPHRLWMMQHLFNISYDRPSVPATITEAALDGILQDQQYRILHRYQAKFQVEASGAIKSSSFQALSPLGDQGKTKINIGVEAGEFNPVWDNPAWVYNLSSDEPELSPKSNKDGKVSADAHAISSYWSARVGAHGRNANWRLMGMDAPWIFSEIIFEIKPDGTVDTRLRTSVDIAWKDGSVTSGTKQFNNLNIYKRTVTALQREVKYERQGLLEMEGKLEPFVKSASGVWPEPPLSPEIQ